MKTILYTNCARKTEFLVDTQYVPFISRFNWICSTISGRDYIATHIRGKTVYLHRVIMCAHSFEMVDHISGDTTDNSVENLRIATPSENAANKPKAKNKTSIYKGVCWDKERKKWMATCNKDGKHISLGRFSDEQSAARAYDNKARELWGEFAYLNFPTAS